MLARFDWAQYGDHSHYVLSSRTVIPCQCEWGISNEGHHEFMPNETKARDILPVDSTTWSASITKVGVLGLFKETG